MPRTNIDFYEQGLFVGPPLSTGYNFVDNSGNFVIWPMMFSSHENPFNSSAGVNLLNTTLTTGLQNIYGKNNVTKMTVNSVNGFHGYFKPFTSFTGMNFTGLVDIDLYIPSSNSILKSLTVSQNGGVSGFSTVITGSDSWIKYNQITIMHFGNNPGGGDNIGITLRDSSAALSWAGNSSDFIYFKNFRVFMLNGQIAHNYYNTIQQLQRLQNINYSFNVGRSNILSQGNNGLLADPIVSYPTVNLEFETLQYSLENEYKVGLTCNFSSPFSGYAGAPFYNNPPSILSGFYSRDLSGINAISGVIYPLNYSDKRNFYITINPEGKVLTSINQLDQLTGNSSIGFGNCYLTNYTTSARIGDFPRTKFTYLCENMNTSDRNYGINPGLPARNGIPITGSYYLLPTFTGRADRPSVISPQDITLSISGIGNNDTINPGGLVISNFKIQGYNIELPLNREPIESLSYKLPINRVINYPIFASIDIDVLQGDLDQSQLSDIINYDLKYNLMINMNAKCQITGDNIYKNLPVK